MKDIITIIVFLTSFGLFAQENYDSLEVKRPSLKMTFSPNPVKDILEISTNNDRSIKEIKIIDVVGNLVYTNRFSQYQTIDMSQLINGVYFILLNSNKEVILEKVLVRH